MRPRSTKRAVNFFSKSKTKKVSRPRLEGALAKKNNRNKTKATV